MLPPKSTSTPTTNIVIDLSHWNTVSDFEKVYLSGIRGVIHKATHGNNVVDNRYKERVAPIRTNGLMHGAYHFGVEGDGVFQAKRFLDTVNPDDRTLLALDFEPNPYGGTMMLAQARAFVSHVHAETGRWPVLYSGHLAKDVLGTKRDAILGNCPLWLAQYGPRPVVQPTWAKWTLWQYTDEGTVPGIKGHVDRNYFAGNLNVLRAFWGYPSLSA